MKKHYEEELDLFGHFSLRFSANGVQPWVSLYLCFALYVSDLSSSDFACKQYIWEFCNQLMIDRTCQLHVCLWMSEFNENLWVFYCFLLFWEYKGLSLIDRSEKWRKLYNSDVIFQKHCTPITWTAHPKLNQSHTLHSKPYYFFQGTQK